MPGRPAREEDTRRSGLLVAESEPDHDGVAGLPDIPPGFLPGVLVLSYRLKAAWLEGDAARVHGLHAEHETGSQARSGEDLSRVLLMWFQQVVEHADQHSSLPERG
jgi:hypothetical protein